MLRPTRTVALAWQMGPGDCRDTRRSSVGSILFAREGSEPRLERCPPEIDERSNTECHALVFCEVRNECTGVSPNEANRLTC